MAPNETTMTFWTTIGVIGGSLGTCFIALKNLPFKELNSIFNKRKGLSSKELLAKLELLSKHDSEYSKNVVLEMVKKNLFFEEYGIYTSSENHSTLINGHLLIEDKYNWKTFKQASGCFKYSKSSLNIVLDKAYWIHTIISVVAILYFSIFGTFFFNNSFDKDGNILDVFSLSFSLVFYAFLIRIISDLRVSCRIIRLKKYYDKMLILKANENL